MTHKSIKLLALAVIFGSSLIGLGATGREGFALLMLAVAFATGTWFAVYWFWIEVKRNE